MSDKQIGQKFILEKLERLSKPVIVSSSTKKVLTIEDEIFNRLMSRKFRKYAASDKLKNRMKEAIAYRVANKLPIKITFMQGGFKLWRLDESPEVDWAELFALMFYSEWLSRVCAVYEHGVDVEIYIMGYIMERISNYTREETLAYQNSFHTIIDFVSKYVPANLKMRLTTMNDRYGSEKEFWELLDTTVSKYKTAEEIILPPEHIKSLELNYRPKQGEVLGSMWREENARIHDAYVKMDSERAWNERKTEIIAVTDGRGWDYGLLMGSTKDSIVKYWVGVGALREKGNTFMPTVLSPSQLANADVTIQDININGLNGKNFKKLRLVKNALPTTSGFARAGVYARPDYCANIQVCSPPEPL